MIVAEARNGPVPAALALALAKVESNFEPQAESPVGAKGVMQLMPKTARDVFGVREQSLWNARLNIHLGLTYLGQLYEQYGHRWDLALSHYNGGTLPGGPGALAIPHDFTRKYVADVLRWQQIYGAKGFAQASERDVAVPQAPWREAADSTRDWKKPARDPGYIDPLEFDDWAAAHHRQAERRIEDSLGRAGG